MEGNAVVTAITNGASIALGFVGDVVSALTTADGELAGILIFLGISVGASGIAFGVRLVRGMVWGW